MQVKCGESQNWRHHSGKDQADMCTLQLPFEFLVIFRSVPLLGAMSGAKVLLQPRSIPMVWVTTKGHAYVYGLGYHLKPCWDLWAMLLSRAMLAWVACVTTWGYGDVETGLLQRSMSRSVVLLLQLWSLLTEFFIVSYFFLVQRFLIFRYILTGSFRSYSNISVSIYIF